MAADRIIIGKLAHPLLSNLAKKQSERERVVVVDWSETSQKAESIYRYRHYTLERLFERAFFPFWLIWFLREPARSKVCVHFIRKEIIVFLVLRKVFGFSRNKPVDLIFWGTDAKSLGILKSFLSNLLTKKDSISCTSIGMKKYLCESVNKKISIKYFPSPNEKILKSKNEARSRIDCIEKIVIGNNGRKSQRHYDALSLFKGSDLAKTVKQVIFPLSYMCEVSLRQLSAEATKMFPNASIVLLSDKLTPADYQKIFSSDMYVNLQEHDAFSTFLIECLASGLVCLVDNRLRYEELDKIGHLYYLHGENSIDFLHDRTLNVSSADLAWLRHHFIYSESMLEAWI